jgi:[citrate (pro-3S)-lyase] ligase
MDTVSQNGENEMDDLNFQIKAVSLSYSVDREKIEVFLEKHHLKLDKDVEYTIAAFDGEDMIGTGSFAGKIIKCIAVEPSVRGMGLSNRIVSELVSEQYKRGNYHLFLFTKPDNYRIFQNLGFYQVEQVENQVILMENDSNGLNKFLLELKAKKVDGQRVASIVVNCNPFTLGHRYLIETAAKENDVLHVFVVYEDKSLFPFEIRFKLVQAGIADLTNVLLHQGSDYIISGATFPSYFIKEEDEVVKVHAKLDLKIFSKRIAPSLGINRRYVGEEPYCNVTRTYNDIMKKILPNQGIDVIEIPRKQVENKAISASFVRDFLREANYAALKKIVPKTTYDFLCLEEAKPIIEKIKQTNSRH